MATNPALNPLIGPTIAASTAIANSNVGAVKGIAITSTTGAGALSASVLGLLQGFGLSFDGVTNTFSLAACVRAILCGLSAATGKALAGFINGFIADLEAQVAILQAKLLYLNILKEPIVVANTAVQLALSKASNAVIGQLVPLQTIGQCFAIGSLTTSIQTNIDLVAGDAAIIAGDLERLVSVGDEIQFEIDALNSTILYYGLIVQTINACSLVNTVI